MPGKTIRNVVVLTATLLGMIVLTTPAFAANRVVDEDGQATFTDCQAPNPTFSTITAAVAVAGPGDIIRVCPGVYNEQVTIGKSLTIRGDNGAILKPGPMAANTASLAAPFAPIAAAIVVTPPPPGTGTLTNVFIETLMVDGADNGFTNCGDPRLIGIFYRNASGRVSSVAVKNMKLPPAAAGCQTGNGIEVQSSAPKVSNVIVQDSSVHDYQKNGIVGNLAGTTLTALRNMVSGLGVTGPNDAAQNGIQIGFGAKGEITSNVIMNHAWGGCVSPVECLFVATNILVFDSDNVKLSTNTLGKSQTSMYLIGDSNNADRNVILDTDFFDGIAVVGNLNRVTTNTIMNSDEAAVYVDGNNNRVEANKINDAQTGILRTSSSGGTIITGNTIVNTESQIAVLPPALAAKSTSGTGSSMPSADPVR